MRQFSKYRRDFYAGGLMVLIGLGAVVEASNYKLGTLMHMGAGFLPVSLGVVLILVGIAIAGTAAASDEQDDSGRVFPEKPDWRGWGCIIAGPILFIVLGKYAGLIPATFSCVFVSAFGDRTATLKATLVLSAGVTVFGVLLFSYLLKVPFPLWRWGSW